MINSPRQAPGGASARPVASATVVPRIAMQTPMVFRQVSASMPRSAPTTMVCSGKVESASAARAAVV